jgi:proteic killer suppression protein
MIASFRNRSTEDIFNGRNTRRARQLRPRSLWGIAARKLDQLDSAMGLQDLMVPPGNRLKSFRG